MSETWHVLNSGPGSAASNMAIDEALHEWAAHWQSPVLRFYAWTEPAATFGYSQPYAQVATWTALRPLIRRPTGGGLVPHDADWTYSLTVPPTHSWFQLKAVESYRAMHEWVRSAFAALRVQTDLAPIQQRAFPGQCFAGAEKFDLLWGGVKMAGAAQRRNRLGLLIQGSVQPPAGSQARRADWERAMLESGPEASAIQWDPLPVEDALRARAEQLAAEKYAQASYNQRR